MHFVQPIEGLLLLLLPNQSLFQGLLLLKVKVPFPLGNFLQRVTELQVLIPPSSETNEKKTKNFEFSVTRNKDAGKADAHRIEKVEILVIREIDDVDH